MDFVEVLRPAIVDLQMEANHKQEVITKLAELLFADGAILSREEYINDVNEREQEGPTGIGNFVAIPHGKSDSVVKISVAMAKLQSPIPWETLDGNPVKIVFLFAVPKQNSSNEHLKLLSQLAAVLAHDDSIQLLLEVQNPEDIFEVFKSQKTSV
ncbi:MAG TPA: PTS fructose transporter subunit IIA [Firmicutes bacterium]|jgi:fructose PTS system EIIA component|nr:PTS fructose transporter subunit IIA [Bacillota bacterium]